MWGADLDTMVLVNVVMAVGLTVDFSAHISYHCFSQDTDLKNSETFARAIQAVATPSAEVSSDGLHCLRISFFGMGKF